VWRDTVLRREGGQDEFIEWGKVVGEEHWQIPESGRLEFKIMPCNRSNVPVKSSWVTSLLRLLVEGSTNDIAKTDILGNVRKQHYGLSTGILRLLLNTLESKTAKTHAYALLRTEVTDFVEGGMLDLAEEVRFVCGEGKTAGDPVGGIALVYTPRKDTGVGGAAGGAGEGGKEDQGRGPETVDNDGSPKARKNRKKKKKAL
jgi:hypothetical protein